MIRPATADDEPAIKQCAFAAYQKYVDRIGRQPAPMIADFAQAIAAGQVWVSEQHGELDGYLVCFPVGQYIQLENVAVQPDAQGLGVGGNLIGFAEQLASDAGLAGVELYTNEKMFENQRLYPALGYTEVARAVEDGFSRVYYRKRLATR